MNANDKTTKSPRAASRYLRWCGYFVYAISFFVPAIGTSISWSNTGLALFFHSLCGIVAVPGALYSLFTEAQNPEVSPAGTIYCGLVWLSNVPMWLIAISRLGTGNRHTSGLMSLQLIAIVFASLVIVIPAAAQIALGPAYLVWMTSMILVCCSGMLEELDRYVTAKKSKDSGLDQS
jgi:hypothetical protein